MSQNFLEESRMNKLSYVREHTHPYPERFELTHELPNASLLEDGVQGVRVAGRITFMRKMGKLSFVSISDISGNLQIAIKKDLVGDDEYTFFKNGFDIGDFMGVKGEMFTTKTGEKTVRASKVYFLGKALKPLPEKFHGLSNIDNCYRKRYLDLIMNQDTKDRFLLRVNFIKEVRRFLEDNRYLEIETPILTDHPSGASARPFVSYHNALDMDVHLRIAPETYLKRAVVGGIPRVFEFARCFRNEGISPSHLQDFTMLEAYCAYYNHKDNMVFIQQMLTHVLSKLFGQSTLIIGDNTVNFGGEWPVISFRELILKDCNIDITLYPTATELLEEIRRCNIQLESETDITLLGRGNLIDLLYKKVSRPKLINPTFLTEHPTALSPLARANDDNPDIVDRFQLIINGTELINGYSELVDPIDQRNRLMEQAKLNAAGDDEAMVMDEDYITAMEHGMPPISGWGMGIDRILKILTNQENIRDMVMFPLMRPLD